MEWSRRLGGLTPQQIQHGLDAWRESWPPSSEEFRDVCLDQNQPKNEFGLDYIPEYYRTPETITDRSHLLSSEQRDKKRNEARERIAAMRDAIKGKPHA